MRSLISCCLLLLLGSEALSQQVFFGGKRFTCRPSANGKERRCCNTEFRASSSSSQCIDLVPIPVPIEGSGELNSFSLPHPDPRLRFQPRHSSQGSGAGLTGAELTQPNFRLGFGGFSLPQGRRQIHPPALPPPGTPIAPCGQPRCQNPPPCSTCGGNNFPQQRRQFFPQANNFQRRFPQFNGRSGFNFGRNFGQQFGGWPNNRQEFQPRPSTHLGRPVPGRATRIGPLPPPPTPAPFLNPIQIPLGGRRPNLGQASQFPNQPKPAQNQFPWLPRSNGQFPRFPQGNNLQGPQPQPNAQRPPFVLNKPGLFLPGSGPPVLKGRQPNQPRLPNQQIPLRPDGRPQQPLPPRPNGRSQLPPRVQRPPTDPDFFNPQEQGQLPPLPPLQATAPPQLPPRETLPPAEELPPSDYNEEYPTDEDDGDIAPPAPAATTSPPSPPPVEKEPKVDIDVKAIPAPRVILKPTVVEATEEEDISAEFPIGTKGEELPEVIKGRFTETPDTFESEEKFEEWPEESSTEEFNPPPTESSEELEGGDGHNLPWPPRVLPGRVKCRRPWGCLPDRVVTSAPTPARRFFTTRPPRPQPTQPITTAPAPPPPAPLPHLEFPEFPEFPQPPPNTRCFLDLMFIIDASGSVKKTFHTELDLAARTVEKLTLGEDAAKVALIRFAGPRKARVIFGFSDALSKEEIKTEIMGVQHLSGTTETTEALELAAEEFAADKGSRLGTAKPVAILFTDGFSATDPTDAAARLRNKGVVVFALAIDRPRDEKELANMAGTPARVYTDETFQEFQTALETLTRDC